MIPTARSIERRHSSSDFRGYWHLPHFRGSVSVLAPQLGHSRVSAMASPSYRQPPSPGSNASFSFSFFKFFRSRGRYLVLPTREVGVPVVPRSFPPVFCDSNQTNWKTFVLESLPEILNLTGPSSNTYCVGNGRFVNREMALCVLARQRPVDRGIVMIACTLLHRRRFSWKRLVR